MAQAHTRSGAGSGRHGVTRIVADEDQRGGTACGTEGDWVVAPHRHVYVLIPEPVNVTLPRIRVFAGVMKSGS